MLKFTLNYRTGILLVITLVLLVLFLWLVYTKDSVWDLILNLSSEGLGMIITIGIIDQILKNQEEKKWKPALGMIYSDILKTTDCLLFEIVPASFRKVQIRTYTFNKTSTTLGFFFDWSDINRLKRELESDVEKLIGTESIIDELHRQLDYILRFSGFILDPAVFHFLVEIDMAINVVRRLPIEFSEDFRDDFTRAYLNLAQAGHKLYEHLISTADQSSVY